MCAKARIFARMKQLLTLLLAAFALPIAAQSSQADSLRLAQRPMEPLVMPIHTQPSFGMWGYGFMPLSLYHWTPAWQLHEGFNAHVSMNVMAGWGKHAPSGAGFGQNLSLAYAKPINSRLSLAVGLYANNLNWDHLSGNNVGLAAVVRYQANDWLRLYGYASQNITANRRQEAVMLHPYSLYAPYAYAQPDTRVGAAAEIKLGERAALTIQVDYVRYDAPDSPIPAGFLQSRPQQADHRLLNER